MNSQLPHPDPVALHRAIFQGRGVPNAGMPLLMLRTLLVSVGLFGSLHNLALAEESDPASAFGTLKESQTGEAALVGTFYDIKQNFKRETSGMGSGEFPRIVRDFLMSGWDEKGMTKYYRASKTMLASHIFIPDMSADNAPRGFEVEKTVKPSCWFVHYKAVLVPPEDAIYRFVGGSDDILAVAVDGKIALVAWYLGNTTALAPLQWTNDPEAGSRFSGHDIHYGNWIECKKERPITIDILIGEQPGGSFGAGLLIQKQGETYEKDDKGNPILPVFQVTTGTVTDVVSAYTPKRRTDAPLWKALQ